MKGVVLYKVSDPQIIRETVNLVKEFRLKHLVLCGVSSGDALPGISYALRESERFGFSVSFYSHLRELFEPGAPLSKASRIATLSTSMGSEKLESVDWLILGYLDLLDVRTYGIKVFKIGNHLGEIAALTKFLLLAETHEI
jgi:SpoU rRNA methylase family enzyme